MEADMSPPGSKGIRDRAFGQYGVATVVQYNFYNPNPTNPKFWIMRTKIL